MTPLETLGWSALLTFAVLVLVLLIWAGVCLHSGAKAYDSIHPVFPANVDTKEVPRDRIA